MTILGLVMKHYWLSNTFALWAVYKAISDQMIISPVVANVTLSKYHFFLILYNRNTSANSWLLFLLFNNLARLNNPKPIV